MQWYNDHDHDDANAYDHRFVLLLGVLYLPCCHKRRWFLDHSLVISYAKPRIDLITKYLSKNFGKYLLRLDWKATFHRTYWIQETFLNLWQIVRSNQFRANTAQSQINKRNFFSLRSSFCRQKFKSHKSTVSHDQVFCPNVSAVCQLHPLYDPAWTWTWQ